MKRYLPLLILILIGVAVAGWHVWRVRGGQAPSIKVNLPGPRPTPPKPLEPMAPEVAAGDRFMAAWMKNDANAVYEMLSAKMQKMVTQQEFAAQMADIKFTDPKVVAHTAAGDAGYVIYRVQAAAPAQGEKPLAGYSLLLKNEAGQWRVAFLQAEEKVSEKYEDLRLSPAPKGGWNITYQNEQGQVATISLPEL